MDEKGTRVFKTSLVGGFDRHDVIDYVKELSGERNSLKTQLEAEQAETARLRDGNARLTAQLESAAELLRGAYKSYSGIGDELKKLTEAVEEELKR
ncbi:MAG: hypothetical protein LBN99_00535 [Oscillospiraceae bacterium]|jgi:predicted nuclease with TOPRIM domain|nr:hypothetical protein [Oscillospiraceae bacterium]